MANYDLNAIPLGLLTDSIKMRNANVSYVINYNSHINVSTVYCVFTDSDGSNVTLDTEMRAFYIGDARGNAVVEASLISNAEAFVASMEI